MSRDLPGPAPKGLVWRSHSTLAAHLLKPLEDHTLLAQLRRMPNGALRVLMVAPAVPYPPTWGAAARNYHLLRALSARHEVSLLAEKGTSAVENVPALLDICHSVRTIERRHWAPIVKRLDQGLQLLRGPDQGRYWASSPAISEELRRWQAERGFDVLLFESPYQADAAPPAPGPLVVLDAHNIEHELVWRQAAAESSRLRRAFYRIDSDHSRAAELRAWGRVHAHMATSDRDMARIQAVVPGKPGCVVPNGVDLEYFQPRGGQVDPDCIVFTGRMDYRPNTDAVLHFAKDVLPRLWRTRPQVRFQIVGMAPPPEVRRLAGARVEVTGAVTDVRPYLAAAAVAVVPLRMGGGTRLKVLEALAMEKPLVSSSIGSEGLALQHGRHLEVADGAEEMAAAILALLEDPGRAARLAEEGRRAVVRDYGWPAVTAGVAEFVADQWQRQQGRPALAEGEPGRGGMRSRR